MRILKSLFVNFLIVSLLSSCSTMFNSGSQSILARSSDGKRGIKVQINSSSGSYETELPSNIITHPSSFETTNILVIDQCYNSTTTMINKTIASSYWANILNIYGFLIDWVTGAMWRYDSNVLVLVDKKRTCDNMEE